MIYSMFIAHVMSWPFTCRDESVLSLSVKLTELPTFTLIDFNAVTV